MLTLTCSRQATGAQFRILIMLAPQRPADPRLIRDGSGMTEPFAGGCPPAGTSLLIRATRSRARGCVSTRRGMATSPAQSAALHGPNPGRDSTYRRGIVVQTTGTGSDFAPFR